MISRSINLTRVVLAKNMSFTFTLNKHFQWYTCNSKRLMFQQSFFPIKISQLQLYHSSRTALTNDENDRETLKEAVRELSEGQASLLSHPPIETLRKWDSLSLSDLSVNQLEELARAYFEGTTDFPADDVRAVSVWKTAMERGSIESSYSYAVCLREGKGIEKDTTKAYQIFRKLAESHNYPLAHVSHFIE